MSKKAKTDSTTTTTTTTTTTSTSSSASKKPAQPSKPERLAKLKALLVIAFSTVSDYSDSLDSAEQELRAEKQEELRAPWLFAWKAAYDQQEAKTLDTEGIILEDPMPTVATMLAAFEQQVILEILQNKTKANNLNPMFYKPDQTLKSFDPELDSYLVSAAGYLTRFGCLNGPTDRQGGKVFMAKGFPGISVKRYHLAGFLRFLLWNDLLQSDPNHKSVPEWFRTTFPMQYNPGWEFAHDCHNSFCYMYGHITWRPADQNKKTGCNSKTYLGSTVWEDGEVVLCLICEHSPCCILPIQSQVRLVRGSGEINVSKSPDLSTDLLWEMNLFPVPLKERLTIDQFTYTEPSPLPDDVSTVTLDDPGYGFLSKLRADDPFLALQASGLGWARLNVKVKPVVKTDSVGTFYVKSKDLVNGKYMQELDPGSLGFHSMTNTGHSYYVWYSTGNSKVYLSIRLRKSGSVLPDTTLDKKGLEQLLSGTLVRLDVVVGMTKTDKNSKGKLQEKFELALGWMERQLTQLNFSEDK